MAIIVGVSVSGRPVLGGPPRHDVVMRDTERDEIRTYPRQDEGRTPLSELAAFVAWVAKSEKADAVHVIGHGLGAQFCDLLEKISAAPVYRIEQYSEAVAATYMLVRTPVRNMIDNARDLKRIKPMDLARIARTEVVDEDIAGWMFQYYDTRIEIGSPMTPDIVKALSSAHAARELPDD